MAGPHTQVQMCAPAHFHSHDSLLLGRNPQLQQLFSTFTFSTTKSALDLQDDLL